MRFMIIRKADRQTEAGALPSRALIEAMVAYNEELLRAGVLRGGDGLRSSTYGARITFAGGKPTVVDGPFAETKELIAGFTIIEVGSREEALAWVRRWPVLDGDGNVELELRQFAEAEDFGEAFTEELQAQEASQRARLEGN